MKTYAVLFVLAFLASLAGTPLLRRLWERLGFLDSAIAPGPHLRRPVPRLGGVVIYAAVVGALLALFFHSNDITRAFRNELPIFWQLIGPATLILLVGVADDIWGMRAGVKFLAQMGAALWLISSGVQILHLSLPWGETYELGWLSPVLTLLWLVALTNDFNLIDGLDGLAAGVGFISATAIAVAAPLLAFALPVADTAVTVLRRTVRGQPIFISDRHHIHHRLLALGLTPRRVVLLLYGVSAAAALGCILIARGHNLVTGMVLLLFMGACWIGVRRLGYPEFAEFGPIFSRGRVEARIRLLESAEGLRQDVDPGAEPGERGGPPLSGGSRRRVARGHGRSVVPVGRAGRRRSRRGGGAFARALGPVDKMRSE